ncbi:MAG TPA: M14 family zinc carboxypeptidase [Candidatus Thermoplasmatota archaeon]|nr:M14 family zinc carboxypeptidase [Candidatus Thermoplasmatota archaeon]
MRLLLALVALALVAPSAVALPTPGFNGAASDAVLGRVFPEALQTNDYISYAEARAGLDILVAENPDRLELLLLGPSLGWQNPLTGEREPHDIFVVEVTNEKSAVPVEQKRTLVFILSIHGNEKGAREGGLRVIEDLARGIGLAAEEPDLLDMLDYQKLSFIFANADGWTHEEAEYRASGGVRPDHFTRENANRTDLNRQFPTVGYLYEQYTPLSEPEPRAMAAYTKSLTNVVAGADMHGMIQNSNLVRLLLKDGQKSQQRLFENQRLAELYKERLNGNPHYDAWASAPDVSGVCCGQVAEWAATFDAIGYSASGTAGAWIVQRQGLDAPGYTVEFAYNHLVTDNYYPGAGAQLNDYHVEATRDIVSVFMRYAAQVVMLSVETHGKKTAVLANPYVATNADDDRSAYSGWFAETDLDDAFDIQHNTFHASPHSFWTDLAQYVRNGDAAGVVDSYDSAPELVRRLDQYQNVVVPGTAHTRLANDAAALAALKAWVQRGGNLLLTDSALQLAPALGVAAQAGNKSAYSGYMDILDRKHPFTSNLAGFPRQTYDPNPLGFAPGTSPVWYLDRQAWEDAGGVTVGAVGKKGTGEAVVESPAECAQGIPLIPLRLTRPGHDHAGEGLELGLLKPPMVVANVASAWEKGVDCEDLDAVVLGEMALGSGRLVVFGAILPDPTEASNHPYGLDGHAVAANGNLALLNILGYEYVYSTPPAIDMLEALAAPRAETSAAIGAGARVPAPGALLALSAVGAALLLRRRRG